MPSSPRYPQIGPGILKQVAESYRKLRGTLRFLLGSLADYDPASHAVPYEQLPAVDQFVLGRHAEVMAEVQEAYETYQVGDARGLVHVCGFCLVHVHICIYVCGGVHVCVPVGAGGLWESRVHTRPCPVARRRPPHPAPSYPPSLPSSAVCTRFC